jgi:RNA polymerase sigma factor (sigma-70 family)
MLQPDALERYIRSARPRLLSRIRLKWGLRDDAEDVMQDALIRTIRYADHFIDGLSIEAWFWVILSNACRRHLSQRRADRTISLDDCERDIAFESLQMPTLEEAFIESVERQATVALARAAMSRLSPRLRADLYMRYFEQIKSDSVALAEIVQSPATARSRTRRARQELKPILSENSASEKRE